jgi:rhodanese-related sulfurtransferase
MSTFDHQPLPQITVIELSQKLASPKDLQLVDVRETWEVETAGLPGFIVLPLSDYAEWSGDIHTRLDAQKETLVLCHHGMRSAQMCQWLIQQGFTQVKNISGGIDAYAIAVDRSLPRY